MKLSPLALLALLLFAHQVMTSQTAGLRATGHAGHTAGDSDSAITYARERVRLHPEDPSNWYRMAYLFSLRGEVDSSLVWLDASVSNGFTDYLHFELDSDLQAIRSDPRYRSIVEKARRDGLRVAEHKALVIREGEWTPIVLKHSQELPAIEAHISFDHSALLVRATVRDEHFKDGERAWRYGDGFMVTFAVPSEDSSGYTDRFHAFGFSLERGKPACVLVNRDGIYFLRHLDEMAPTITVDTASMSASYLMRIPWTQLRPFHPLLDSRGGFNIRYTSRGPDGTTRLTYLENSHFDSERTPLRRFVPATFLYQSHSASLFTGRVRDRLTAGDSGTVTIAAWSPASQVVPLQLDLHDRTGSVLWEDSTHRTLAEGRAIFQSTFPIPPRPGIYTITVRFLDGESWSETFGRHDVSDLARAQALVAHAQEEECSLERANSLDALQYHHDVLMERIRRFTRRDDPLEVLHAEQVFLTMVQSFESSGTIYRTDGYLLSAFRSSIDSTLQPFSIVLPETLNSSKRCHLYVALHGSGVDEVGFAHSAAKNIVDPDAIILAPRGRDISGWWLGKDEADAVALVGLVKKMFSIERTLCLGFSMGGYGTWRLGMLHPELFDAAAIMSGTPVPPGRTENDADMRSHVGKGNTLSYIVFHGTEDKSLPIAPTDAFVEILRQAGYDIRYVRQQGGGHGNMDIGKDFGRWMAEKFLKHTE